MNIKVIYDIISKLFSQKIATTNVARAAVSPNARFPIAAPGCWISMLSETVFITTFEITDACI